MKLLAIILVLFSYQTLPPKPQEKVIEDPCLSIKQQFRDITQIAELDEEVLDDNADMLTEFLALDDPKVTAIVTPHVRHQLELMYQAEEIKERYRRTHAH